MASISIPIDSSYLLVKGIEDWIAHLLPIHDGPNDPSENFLRMKDLETGAEFLIRRTK